MARPVPADVGGSNYFAMKEQREAELAARAAFNQGLLDRVWVWVESRPALCSKDGRLACFAAANLHTWLLKHMADQATSGELEAMVLAWWERHELKQQGLVA